MRILEQNLKDQHVKVSDAPEHVVESLRFDVHHLDVVDRPQTSFEKIIVATNRNLELNSQNS